MQVQFPEHFSPEQLTILRSTPRPIEIIKGAAGSGKTITALAKMAFAANYYLRAHRRARVQILSFNRTLQGYVKKIMEHPDFRRRLPGDGNLSIDVDTFARWGRRICGHDDRTITNPTEFLDAMLANHENRPLADRFNDDFIANEMEYVLKRFPHDALDAYIHTTRTGRGQSPVITTPQRKILIDEYILLYMKWKAENKKIDWNDIAWQTYSETSPTYDIIVVDEGQDFSANQYRAVMKSLLSDSCFICVVDSAQTIYLNGFTWGECGIDAVRYQPQTLKHNFRNTRQIAQLAKALLAGMQLDGNGVMPALDHDMTTGPVPVLLEGQFPRQLSSMIERIKEAERREETSAILMKSENGVEKIREVLENAGMDFEKIVRTSVWPDRDTYLVLSTMHSAKGLEFDHVFMPGVNDKLFPSSPPAEPEAAERDRRLLAMAVGRARKTVTIGQKPGESCPYFDPLPETLLRRERV